MSAIESINCQTNAIIYVNDTNHENVTVKNSPNMENTINDVKSSVSYRTEPEIDTQIVNDIKTLNTNDLSDESKRKLSNSSSIDSNKVSIKTINENDESSTCDSDSDAENINVDENAFRSSANHEIVLVNKNIDSDKLSQSNIINKNDAEKPNIGSIAIQNSSDITFGDKTFINGPVTIKQFLVKDENTKWNNGNGNAYDNPAFSSDISAQNGS